MAPAEDTTGNWDSFILPTLLDDLHSARPFCLASRCATSVTPSTCDLTMSDFPTERREAEAIHDYASASGHASASSSPTKRQKRKSSNNRYPMPPLDLYAHVNATRVLPAGQSCDDVFIESSFANEEASLSPLTLYSPWDSSHLGCTPFGPEMLQGHKDSTENEEVDPLVKTFQWSSPTSTDTDLDESPFSSIASLSPEDQFRHYSLEDDDSPYASSSPPMLHDPHNNLNTIYHPLDQYPSNAFDLYHPDTDSDGSLSPLSPLSQPSSLPPFAEANYCSTLPSPPSPLQTFGLGLSPYLPVHSHAERSFLYNPYADHEIGIPSSPSRRRSMDLPSFDDDDSSDGDHDTAFAPVEDAHASGRASQLLKSDQERTSPPARNSTWLNLPGAETDDSLVCPELALKGYDPEPASTVSSAPPAGLLLWDADIEPRLYGSAKEPARPPSPEDFVVDPNVVARIAGDEGEKVYWLRERTAAARKEKWEKEKYGELSALLRLKLEALSALDRKDADKITTSPEVVPIPPPSEPSAMPADPCSGSADICPESCPTPTPSSVGTHRASTAPASFSSLAAHHLKPRITSMAQLVANMVFHRQQQPEISGRSRRTPRRAQSQLIESCTRSPPPAKTPKSPLRQMVLPEPESDEDDDGNCSSSGSSNSILQDGSECESPLPLSPLALAMMPLPLAFEEKHE